MSCVSLGTTGDGDSSQMVQKWLPSFWWVLLVPYLSGPQFPQLSEKLWLDLWFLKEEVSNFLINLKGWDTKKKKTTWKSPKCKGIQKCEMTSVIYEWRPMRPQFHLGGFLVWRNQTFPFVYYSCIPGRKKTWILPNLYSTFASQIIL